MKDQLIEPKILKGFQDTLPNVALRRQEMLLSLQAVFASFGFTPIDTPALEYTEILLGKGSAETDKQLFRFNDNGGRDVAMRFDLTIPLARFVAMHQNELTFPFKRYHIAPVWRAEKPQKGRYREFVQCDFDTIGSDSKTADAEILAMVSQGLRGLQLGHTIRMNNRKILNGVLESLGIGASPTAVLRAVDKLEKLGREVVERELAEEAGLNEQQISRVFEYIELSNKGLEPLQLFVELEAYLKDSELGRLGVKELSDVYSMTQDFGAPKEDLEVDLTIARGLDYYTATVFETRLRALPSIGSICSGGRYDDLASLYTRRRLPGVGGSVGLDRIIGALAELGELALKSSPAEVFVTMLDEESKTASITIAKEVREKGIACEVALEPSSLGGQLKYADRKGIGLAIIVGQSEIAASQAPVKNLMTKEQSGPIPFSDLASYVAAIVKG